MHYCLKYSGLEIDFVLSLGGACVIFECKSMMGNAFLTVISALVPKNCRTFIGKKPDYGHKVLKCIDA